MQYLILPCTQLMYYTILYYLLYRSVHCPPPLPCVCVRECINVHECSCLCDAYHCIHSGILGHSTRMVLCFPWQFASLFSGFKIRNTLTAKNKYPQHLHLHLNKRRPMRTSGGVSKMPPASRMSQHHISRYLSRPIQAEI